MKSLRPDLKPIAATMFVQGMDMSDVASTFHVSRRHIEQVAREAIQSLSERVVKSLPKEPEPHE